MKALLLKAKEYDAKTGQADCEMEEKIKVLRQVATLVGVDLDEVFTRKAQTSFCPICDRFHETRQLPCLGPRP
jgi:hypothetical protein